MKDIKINPICNCKYCKKEFEQTRKDRVFCSRHCKQYAKDKRLGRTRKGSPTQRKRRRLKGTSCVQCGFVAVHRCQLDIDHIDGNSKNNSPENIQTLCANCHRLKTFIHRDWDKSILKNDEKYERTDKF